MRVVVFLLVLGTCVAAVHARAARTRVPVAILPATRSRGRSGGLKLTIVAKYPDENLKGAQMTIRGDGGGLSWSSDSAMTYTAENTWTYVVEYSKDDAGSVLSFKTLAGEGAWQVGANEQVELPARSGQILEVFPWYWTQEASLEMVHDVYSEYFDNTRDVIFMVPASYHENTLKPVMNTIVMLDGENLFNASTSFGGIAWMCQDTVNGMVNAGAMEEVLIVGVYNTAKRMEEYTYSVDPTYGGGKGDHYLDWQEKVLLPLVAKRYPRAKLDREHLALIGSSLGGLISCYAGWTRPHVYGRVGCMSSSFWWNSHDFLHTVMPKYPAAQPHTLIYLDSGNAGGGSDPDDVQATINVRDKFVSADDYTLGEDVFYYLDDGGQHNEYYWGHRFHVPMGDLYPVTVKQAHGA